MQRMKVTRHIHHSPVAMFLLQCNVFLLTQCDWPLCADALGRILSGTVKPGDRVRVLGEAYTPEDEEDSAVAEVTNVWVYQARYRIPLTKALAGNFAVPCLPWCCPSHLTIKENCHRACVSCDCFVHAAGAFLQLPPSFCSHRYISCPKIS